MAASPGAAGRVAFVLKGYPRLSETFIAQEILALERRGLDILIGAYNLLDLAPKGRDEASLAWPMAWVRHHDRYEGAAVDAKATYQDPTK